MVFSLLLDICELMRICKHAVVIYFSPFPPNKIQLSYYIAQITIDTNREPSICFLKTGVDISIFSSRAFMQKGTLEVTFLSACPSVHEQILDI